MRAIVKRVGHVVVAGRALEWLVHAGVHLMGAVGAVRKCIRNMMAAFRAGVNVFVLVEDDVATQTGLTVNPNYVFDVFAFYLI